MILDLVDRGHHGRVLAQRIEVVDHEVADAERANLAGGQQRLERAVGVERLLEVRRQSLVENQQVDLVDAELARALLEGMQRLAVAVVADPDLGLDEDLGAIETRLAQGLADPALVRVGGSGVHMRVPGLQRRQHRSGRLLGRRLEDAQPERRHLHAIVERDRRDSGHQVARLSEGRGLWPYQSIDR